MRVLLFKNNVHSQEPVEVPGLDRPIALNLTVRKGLKWSDLCVGDSVTLKETGSPQASILLPDPVATIFDIKVMRFSDLRRYAKLLRYEHDPECRTYPGLLRVMKRVYDGFFEDEIVTLVLYEVPLADGPDSPDGPWAKGFAEHCGDGSGAAHATTHGEGPQQS